MVAPVVVALDEGPDPRLEEVAGQVVVLEQDPVLERWVPALDLSLGLGMAGRSPGMVDRLAVEPVGKLGGDVAGAVVG
jgi:hypothetical protein